MKVALLKQRVFQSMRREGGSGEREWGSGVCGVGLADEGVVGYCGKVKVVTESGWQGGSRDCSVARLP